MTSIPQGPTPNPYHPPRPEREIVPIRRSTGIFAIAASFTVDGHQVDLRFDVLGGHEQCCVDGAQVSARKAPLDFRTLHAFTLGPNGKQVTVSCRFWPLLPIRVTVENTLLSDDLFPRHRQAWLASAVGACLAGSLLLFLMLG
jgi:hypothetical protein